MQTRSQSRLPLDVATPTKFSALTEEKHSSRNLLSHSMIFLKNGSKAAGKDPFICLNILNLSTIPSFRPVKSNDRNISILKLSGIQRDLLVQGQNGQEFAGQILGKILFANRQKPPRLRESTIPLKQRDIPGCTLCSLPDPEHKVWSLAESSQEN